MLFYFREEKFWELQNFIVYRLVCNIQSAVLVNVSQNFIVYRLVFNIKSAV